MGFPVSKTARSARPCAIHSTVPAGEEPETVCWASIRGSTTGFTGCSTAPANGGNQSSSSSGGFTSAAGARPSSRSWTKSVTMGLAGSIVLLALALPAFEETSRDWRNTADFAVTFLDRYGKEIGRRGIRQTDFVPIDALARPFHQGGAGNRGPALLRPFRHRFPRACSRALAENVRANSRRPGRLHHHPAAGQEPVPHQ